MTGMPQQPPMEPPAAAPTSQGINGFGLTAIILGGIALAVSWIPFWGFGGFFLAFFGLVFGILGIALTKYRSRRTLGIVGTVICGFAVIVTSILPWITGTMWIFNRLEEEGVFEEIRESWQEEYENPRPSSPSSTWPAPVEEPTPSPTTLP